MKNHSTKLSGFIAILILLAAGLACSDADIQSESANNNATVVNAQSTADASSEAFAIERAEMRDSDENGELGANVVTSFKRSDKKIHCYVGWNNSKADTRLKFVWLAADAGGAKNYKLKEIELKTENEFQNYVSAVLTITKPLPRGAYKVDVYVNDKLERTVPFTIE